VIVFQLGNSFWIEVFHRLRTSVAATTQVNTDFVLEKSGQFLGCAAALDSASAAQIELSIGVINSSGGTELNIGDDITGIRVVRGNDDSVAHTFGGNVVIFMRGRGG